MEMSVRVHFIDGTERIVSAKDIKHVGNEGARRGTALYDGKEYPIYNRVEWGFLWHEQEPVTGVDVDEWAREIQHEENERLI